ncbi:Acetyltransferase (GNAT) family protein [Geodermatophilus telluris]|uniref:Acetyltransferase (GNAT) family protein n=1 Tax=Geodermatophilus telluris TaxID=1190417 RepID=A0A1G6MNV3_9ACTN|nr:GNAT family N-acetyltransferase [Geodermatophilus telluris]SDC57209.1 Acetyltransferase (GNAT) family protein [Geodermatophilus telluris]
MGPAEAAIASERLLRPGVPDSAAPGSAKVLLVRSAAPPLASSTLHLVPCGTDADWARYADARVAVEAGLGLDEPAARAMVAGLRARAARLPLQLWLAPGTDGDPVAAVAAFRLLADPATARLQEVDVFPGHRGAGRGDALLEAVRRLLVADGVTRLVLGADEDDWPLSWYRRRGFVPVARVPRA